MAKYLIREYNKSNPKKKHKTKLNDLMIEKRINVTQLSKLSGLERAQVHNIASGIQTNMFLDNAKKICNALNTSLDETFGDGVVDFKTRLIAEINEKISKLDDRDAEGHLWFNKFKDIILKVSNNS